MNRKRKPTKERCARRPIRGTYDFGDGDGEVPVYFRPLSNLQRTELVTKRFAEHGQLYGATQEKGLYVDAELVHAAVVDEDGNPEFASLEEVLELDGLHVHHLAQKIFRREFPTDTAAAANPSTTTS